MLNLGGCSFKSRLILGTARFPTPEILQGAIQSSGAEIVTLSLRRHSSAQAHRFWEIIQACQVKLLPNTAGCRTVNEAVTTARLAREVFGTHWIKLETVGDDYTLQPDPFELVEAARNLNSEGFEVFPYTTEDLVVAEKLIAAGCKVIMPWGAPIGSGQGLVNPQGLTTLRARFPKTTLIVDAGIGIPSHAARAMEMGCEAVLLNSAVSLARDPIAMAEAFKLAVEAGRLAYEAGAMAPRSFAQPSTPVVGTPFWHEMSSRNVPKSFK